MSTAKNVYSAGETIDATVSINNLSVLDIENVITTITSPMMSAQENGSLDKTCEKICAGDQVQNRFDLLLGDLGDNPYSGMDIQFVIALVAMVVSAAGLAIMLITGKIRMNKTFCLLLLAGVMLVSLIPNVRAAETNEKTVELAKVIMVDGRFINLTATVTWEETVGPVIMKYDDRLDVSMLGMTGEPEITTVSVTSKKVGTDTPDDAVVVYVDGKLIAVGVGTAQAEWTVDGVKNTYQIKVEPATISMLMVTGHSLGTGSQGNSGQSIVCEDGQIYSTNERAYAFKLCTGNSAEKTVEGKDVTGMGLGYGSALRPTDINKLNESGSGVQGMDSALAYRWHQLTGEKVWVLNAAKGSTNLSTWVEDGYNYRHAVELFTTAEEIMYNEVQAGHYLLNKMGIVNYTTANGDQIWEADNYTEAFNSMWNGFREEMAIYDFDGDKVTDTVDCIALLPLWSVLEGSAIPAPLAFYSRADLLYTGKLINYAMSVFENDGVILASNVGRNWTSDADVEAYFKANPVEKLYGKLQNGTIHANPTTMLGGVYSEDGVHYCQIGYNVQGIETAESMYEYWYGLNNLTSVRFLQADGVSEVPDAIELPKGYTYIIVPDCAPTTAKLTYEITGNAATYNNCIVTAEELGQSVLTIKDINGNTVKTVNITVRELTEEELNATTWYTWDFANGSATNTAGVDTNNTLTLHKSADNTVISVSDLLKDGTLTAAKRTTLKLSNSVKLDASEGWMVEIVAKAHGSNAIGTFFSTGTAMNTSTYFYINSNGDVAIVKKGAYTNDAGTSVSSTYTYYMVSDTDFNASELASGNFDVNQYHKYQLRCVDGVISFWLDGVKIGDLAQTETSFDRNNANRYTGGNGSPFDFSLLVGTHIGCGNSSSGGTSQALLGTVKSMSIYTKGSKLALNVGLSAAEDIAPIIMYPGDSIKLPRPNTGDYCAKFLYWATNQDGTGTRYYAGDTYTHTGMVPVSLYGFWEALETTESVHSFVGGVCSNCGVTEGH